MGSCRGQRRRWAPIVGLVVLCWGQWALALSVSLTPASTAIYSGTTTAVDVRIDAPAGVFGYNFGIVYPAALLNVVSVTPGAAAAGCVVTPNADVDGKICLAVACSTDLSGSDVSLVTVTFAGESAGAAPVQFSAISCGGPSTPSCLLEDLNGGVQPCTTNSATIDVSGPQPGPLRGKRGNPARDSTACQALWRIQNPNAALDPFGLPASKQECVDGDATCDFDPAPNVCGFRASLCLNDPDPGLPACSAQGITSAALLAPKADRIRSEPLHTLVAQDIADIQNALQHLSDPSLPAAGYSFAPPLSAAQRDLCSAAFLVRVPVKPPTARPTKQRLAIRLKTTDAQSPRPRPKSTSITLICRSAP